MDITSNKDTRDLCISSPTNCDFLQISCNWQIINNKQFYDAITTAPLLYTPERTDYEDVVSLDTCIALQSIDSNTGPCMLDIKVTNCQKIARIAVVSEANVLEFFKQYGEYENTIFAEFIDEFENNSVYLAETTIQPPSTEASIKFTKTRSKGSVMWIYGIKLMLIESEKQLRTDAFNYEIIRTFLNNANEKTHKGADIAKKVFQYFNQEEILINEPFCHKNLETFALNNSLKCENRPITRNNDTESSNCADDYKKDIKWIENVDIKTYIDNKFYDMERRLMEKINEMETVTNQKLDIILKRLETQINLK